MQAKKIGRERILVQLRNMQKDKVDYLQARPLQNDLYVWHFTFRGPQNTDYHQGIYHGQILLPFEYPFKPPDIIFANKNGRFEVNTKICLTITQYHTEEWNSAWTIRTMLQAVISLFNERVLGHGYLECSSDIRRFFAKASQEYVCEKCGKIGEIVKPRKPVLKIKEEGEVESLKEIRSVRRQSGSVKETQNQSRKENQLIKESNKEIRESNLDRKQSYKVIKEVKKQSNKQINKDIQKQSIKQPQKQPLPPKPKHSQKQQQQEYQKQPPNKKSKTKIKKISPNQFFLQALMFGYEEYLSVINSKKVISQ